MTVSATIAVGTELGANSIKIIDMTKSDDEEGPEQQDDHVQPIFCVHERFDSEVSHRDDPVSLVDARCVFSHYGGCIDETLL